MANMFVEQYIRRLHNPLKKAYAQLWADYLQYETTPPEPPLGLRPLAAQNVRVEIARRWNL